MPESIDPRKLQGVVLQGFHRMKHYRKVTAMLVKEYAGQYYRMEKGLSGEEPANLIFNAVRAIVPILVMKNPMNLVTTEVLEQKVYAELLSMGLDSLDREIKLKDKLRGWVVSALFGLGILKTGLSVSGQMLKFGDQLVDPGQIYTELTDLDDFVFDPVCKNMRESAFLGSRILVPRQMLLDDDNFDHDLVAKLPQAFSTGQKKDEIADLTRNAAGKSEMQSLQDYVHVVELWIPGADALVTIPDPREMTVDGYLAMTEYYGPKEGPYDFLSFAPEVQGNPLPVAPASVWYDMHRMANRIFRKIIDQADRQKDVLLYNPAQADEVQEILDAQDGDTIATTDPKGIMSLSIGGQNPINERMLQQLQIWFNYLSGNPDQMSGQKSNAGTATQAQILQSNSLVSIEDSKDITYDKTADVSAKHAWYMHTDPLINIPLTKRAPGKEDVQVVLTPEQRQGDFLRLAFRIVPRSMGRLDPMTRAKRIMDFATNIIPAGVNTAMMMMQMGVQWNLQRYLTKMADELEIGEWVQDLFVDPEFQNKLAIYMSMGPQDAGKAIPSSITTAGVAQNKGFPGKQKNESPTQDFNAQSQTTSAESQSQNFGAM